MTGFTTGDPFDTPGNMAPPNDVTYARGRLPDRTYLHKIFRLNMAASQDHGQPARYVVKVFDEPAECGVPGDISGGLEWTEELVHTTPGGRKQLRLMIARQAGQVRELQLQRVPTSGDATKLEHILTLDRDGAARLIELVHALKYIPVEGDEQSVRLEDQIIQDFFRDPDAPLAVYNRAPETFRDLIRNDKSARDLVAIAHRKEVVQRFQELLSDPNAFEEERIAHGGRERVWQDFLEENPWILGIGLAGQLLTSWDSEKLEKMVAGFSIAKSGKRADALLRTSGRIRSMVFAEIKHHQTKLLAGEYRPGCWAPSLELAGGVTQVQQTVLSATREIGTYLADKDSDGADLSEGTYLVRPRSFFVVGHLDELRGPGGGVHGPKYQSFELYRRNLYEPEIITLDELLARAEWHVMTAAQEIAP